MAVWCGRLGDKNLWWDESLSLQRAESALLPLLKGHLVIQDGFSQLLTIDQHPFMFFLLEGGLIRLAGDSEFSLRYVSAMAATLLPAVLWVLARWFVRRDIFPPSTPYWAAGFAAISPFFLWFGQEARPYALWGMLAPLSTYLLLRATETADKNRSLHWGWFAGFVLAELMFLTSHFYAVFLLPVHVLIFYLWLAQRNRTLALIVSGLILLGGAAIGILAYWFFIVVQAGGENFASVRLKILVPDLLNAFSLGLSVDISRVWWIDLIFGALMLLGAGWSLRSRAAIRNYGWLPALMVIVPVCMLLLVNLVLPAYMTARQMAVIGGAMLLLLGGGLGVITRYQRWVAARHCRCSWWRRRPTARSTTSRWTNTARATWPAWAAIWRTVWRPATSLLIKSPYSWRIADYYLPLEADRIGAGGGRRHRQLRHAAAQCALGGESRTPRTVQATIPAHLAGPHRPASLPGHRRQCRAVVRRQHVPGQRDRISSATSTLRVYLYLPEVPVYREPPAGIQHPTDIRFGDQIRLIGYDIGEVGSPDLALPVTLYWQAMETLDDGDNYKYLLQLVEAPASEASAPLSVTEREPYDGAVATGYWDQGVNIVEWTELPPPLPATLAEHPDAYQLTLQLYHRDTVEKLPVTESGGLEVLPDGATVVLPLETASP